MARASHKLGTAQHGLLSFIAGRPKYGLTKDQMLSSDWRVVDRLEALGLVDNRFVTGHGPTYFINNAGLAKLQDSANG